MRLLALLLALLAAAPARASFEDVPVSARSVGMAAANVADVEDAQSIFLNPAALAGVNRYEAYAAYDKELTGLSDGSSIGRQIIDLGLPFKFGTFGLGIDQYSAASLYKENTEALNFSKAVGRNTWIGVNFKELSLSYGQDSTSAPNPVLGASKSGISLDLGVIHEAKAGYRWGLSIRDANQPNMGIMFSNPVDRKIDFGYSFPILNRLRFDPAINLTGSDYKLNFGMEAAKPGSNFAFRGGFNVGSNSYRNLAFGFGYRTRNFQIDYAMFYPISGVQTSIGTQQIGLTARWGRAKRRIARDEQEQEEEEAENPEFKNEVVEAKPAPPSTEEAERAKAALEDAKKDLMNGRFAEGLDQFKEADPSLVAPAELEEAKAMAAKAANIAPIYPTLRGSDDKTRLLKLAVGAYLQGDGKQAVNAITYAWQLNPNDTRVARLRAIILKAFPLETFDLNLLPGVTLTDQKDQQALELIYEGKYTSAVEECKEVLDLDPQNVLAMVRMGSAFWAMGMKKNARAIWRQAEKLDPRNQVLRRFLNGRVEGEEEQPAPEKPTVTATPEVRADFNAKMEYYERLKRSGADNATLASILSKIIKQFEGSGIDLTNVYQEYQQVQP